jgi:hypothetical protein
MSLSGMLYEVLVLLLELLCCPASPKRKVSYTCASIFALRKVHFRVLIEGYRDLATIEINTIPSTIRARNFSQKKTATHSQQCQSCQTNLHQELRPPSHHLTDPNSRGRAQPHPHWLRPMLQDKTSQIFNQQELLRCCPGWRPTRSFQSTYITHILTILAIAHQGAFAPVRNSDHLHRKHAKNPMR